MIKYRFGLIMAVLPCCSLLMSAQEVADTIAIEDDFVMLPQDSIQQDENSIFIPSLFEYVVAPEELPDLQSKSDYLMDNFWNPMDFKKAKTVDQIALNHAFNAYAEIMPYASYDKVMGSVKKLINNIKNNPGLSYQFCKAAEESLYGPRANFWIDEIYIQFLENLINNKKVDKNKKIRYADQLRILKNTERGARFPHLEYITPEGKRVEFKPTKEFTLVEFGNPECDECSFAKLKLEISSVINDLIDFGRMELAFIIPDDESEELLPQIKDYPEKWTKGSGIDTIESFDLRATPAFYILDKEGKIVAKNVGVETAVGILEEMAKDSNKK